MSDTSFQWTRTLQPNLGRIRLLGYAAIATLAATFGLWAATAPLSGAILASGVVAAAGRNVIIQHLEGGIVSEILVLEGEQVEAGQTLLLLDPTDARTQFNRLAQQWLTHQASIARLTAERDGLDFMPDLPEAPFPLDIVGDAEAVVDEQDKEFSARLSNYRSELTILGQRVATLDKSREGLTAQKDAVAEQIRVVADELRRKERLLDKGLINRIEYSQLLLDQAELIGQQGMSASELASTDTKRIEALEEIERVGKQRVEDALSKLNETRALLADVEEQMQAARAVLERAVVRAPVDGIVVSSVYNARGGVIAPGEEVMEILPTSKELVIDARLLPQDIDAVKIGQKARLRLSALNARLTPEVSGEVIHVSADRLTDEATQEPYYLARVQISEELPPPLTRDQLYPGMPVEALIGTGERTFLEYLSKPITDSFSRAFIEE